ncbi:hypothetical protein ACQ1Q1_01340 [Ornithobacterium rhinotracheale]|uniref:Uncharacterized protein n=1 Tax=Ornithobacterium rhinotracheale (strain ATCC 51463 / DSM 15997 / CCUG 23171 / CIP 104009 / LMG 9086) TaxID=867902 RepID=I4A2K0_ORNRL|nr:hypothetical protein [Ornithobacterium rhinotracheale]AFL98184.1 hypothetical protein Ornrh_2051 [Ornithobacterium rhinotracheale DSM 15997]AIP99930.1 hypothetical protein Q785_10140 [Ornithobacterium rhinotracheale ORT-UMN 88]MCK0193517.1 hypothetical protein [Ornithobacterium rhinotracheale]UOH63576.1 hypothetical protein MT993_11275 [Ornithobacterium rhinotracheale]UOH66417.1 hypothetical protein MT999_03160 [Ornithobacterium rhinotracheale]
MIRKIEQIKGVDKILSLDKKVFIIGGDKSSKEICQISNEFNVSKSLEIIYRDKNDVLEIYDEEKDLFIEVDEKANYLIQSQTDKSLMLIFKAITDEFYIYNYKQNKAIDKYISDKNICIYSNNCVVVTKGLSYTKRNALDYFQLGEFNIPLWTYTCPEGRKIEGQLYEYEGVLVLSHRDNDFNISAVGLDINTGKKLWERVGTHTLGAKNKDKIYNFVSSHKDNRDYLQILDIKTGQLEEKTLTTNQKNDYIVWLSTYRDGKIYCSNLAHGCKLGVIDVESKELIVEFPLNLKDGVQIDAPVVTEDKIYILDSQEVLHIYEREI